MGGRPALIIAASVGLAWLPQPIQAAAESTLASLQCLPDANGPREGVVADRNGNLYGTGFAGGSRNLGAVFKIAPAGTSWIESVLYSFGSPPPPLSDATSPEGGLLAGKAGVFYGTGYFSNDTGCGGNGCGAVYMLKPPAKNNTLWQEQVLYAFSGTPDGANPVGDLIADGTGALYGVTQNGGAIGAGSVFKLTPPAQKGRAWPASILYSFHNSNDGGYPAAGLVLGTGGALYGTTSQSGSLGAGVVFKLAPPAQGKTAWSQSVLYTFGLSGAPDDGDQPMGKLVLDKSGALYGTTVFGGTAGRGTVFRLTPPGSGKTAWGETTLHSFANGADGALPEAGLLLAANGVLFGTTEGTGASGSFGSVFKLLPPPAGATAWRAVSLYRFTGGADGEFPLSTLIVRPGGTLFGTTLAGGTQGCGVVFEVAQ
jgi:uncharacterized repeat protein (TIGR03803 family)